MSCGRRVHDEEGCVILMLLRVLSSSPDGEDRDNSAYKEQY